MSLLCVYSFTAVHVRAGVPVGGSRGTPQGKVCICDLSTVCVAT